MNYEKCILHTKDFIYFQGQKCPPSFTFIGGKCVAEIKDNTAWNAKNACGKISFGHGYLMRAIPKVHIINLLIDS